MATRESHGITTELANKHGSNANSVLSEFITILQKLPQDGFIIAHGMKRENIIFENIVLTQSSWLYGRQLQSVIHTRTLW